MSPRFFVLQMPSIRSFAQSSRRYLSGNVSERKPADGCQNRLCVLSAVEVHMSWLDDVGKVIPIAELYRDLAQPTTQEIGEALGNAAKVARFALAPIDY